jgi:hypothetical protein
LALRGVELTPRGPCQYTIPHRLANSSCQFQGGATFKHGQLDALLFLVLLLVLPFAAGIADLALLIRPTEQNLAYSFIG